MDTIGTHAIYEAADRLGTTDVESMFAVVHTATITLNGQHGGCDLILQGTPSDPDMHGDPLTVKIPFGTCAADFATPEVQ